MSNEVALRIPAGAMTSEDIEILRTTVFKELTNDEIKFAVNVCNRTKLDPFLKQIHFIKRRDRRTGKDVIAIQVGIDGFRLSAQRTGEYAGSDDPVFDDEKKPTKATVTIYRIVKGTRVGFTATARWDEFCPGPPQDFMWKSKPCVMLGKCAEAQALRKGFPHELSGMHTPEELANEPETPGVVAPEHPAAGECGEEIDRGEMKVGKWAKRHFPEIEKMVGLEEMQQWHREAEGRFEKAMAGGKPPKEPELWKHELERMAAYIGEREMAMAAAVTAGDDFDRWSG